MVQFSLFAVVHGGQFVKVRTTDFLCVRGSSVQNSNISRYGLVCGMW